MKLWDKGIAIEKKIEDFTVGDDRLYDTILARYDVRASIAHVQMLQRVGLLADEEMTALCMELERIAVDIERGDFLIEDQYEDVHSKLEAVLVDRLGDAGKKIHTARSRNDQVLVMMHLYLKEELKEIRSRTITLFNLLLELSEKHRDVLMPGYTHLQIAMPSSFGLWFGAYAESFIDDMLFVNAAYGVADQNPLGSAAGYGSSFPIDRQFTTDLLDFSTMKYNVVAAQMSRGKVEKSTSIALSMIAGTLGRCAMDIVLYLSQNFGFISFPDQLTTGSSIMPHKKNPDVFELIRAKCSRIQSTTQQITLLTHNLPSGYHRDLQLLKEIIMPAIEDTKICLDIMTHSLSQIEVNTDILSDSKYDYLYSVDTLNAWVMEGMPFRDAYRQMAAQIAAGRFVPDRSRSHTHLGSIGHPCVDEIRAKMRRALETV